MSRDELKSALAEAHQEIERLKSARDENNWLEGAMKKRTTQLNERVKELDCVYAVVDLFIASKLALPEMFNRLVALMPNAWQFPKATSVRLIFDGRTYESAAFQERSHARKETVRIGDAVRGSLEVFSREPFLPEEEKLLRVLSRIFGIIRPNHGS